MYFLSHITFHRTFAPRGHPHRFHIWKSQTKTLDIVYVSGWNAVEFSNMLFVLLWSYQMPLTSWMLRVIPPFELDVAIWMVGWSGEYFSALSKRLLTMLLICYISFQIWRRCPQVSRYTSSFGFAPSILHWWWHPPLFHVGQMLYIFSCRSCFSICAIWRALSPTWESIFDSLVW